MFSFRFLVPVLLLVLASFVTIDTLFTHFVVNKTNISTTGRIRFMLETEENIIPILGSSRARCSYIPEKIHPNAFNVGIDGASLEVSLVLLDLALQRQNIDTVILNFDYDTWITIGDKRDYIPLTNYIEIKKLLLKNTTTSYWNTLPGIRYFNAYEYYMKEYINEKIQFTKKVKRGYTYDKNEKTFNRIEFENFIKERNKETRIWQISSQIQRLVNLVKVYPEKKVFVIVGGYHKSYINTFRNIDSTNAKINKHLKNERIHFIAPNTNNYPE